MTATNSVSVLNGLQAESLLKDSSLFKDIEELKAKLLYKTGDSFISFHDYYSELQSGIDSIPGITLAKAIPQQQETRYQNELLIALEEIQDRVEKATIAALQYQALLLRVKADITDLCRTFESWYYVAALEFLKDAGIKLPAQNVKALGTSEFNRLIDRSNLSIDTLLEALKVELKRLDSKRKTAKLKFDLGREQANAAYAKLLPEYQGIDLDSPVFQLLEPEVEEPEDEIPAFVSHTGEIVYPPKRPAAALKAVEPEEPASIFTFMGDMLDFDHTDFDDLKLAAELLVPKPQKQIYKTGDAMLITEDFTLASATDVAEYVADVRLHMDIVAGDVPTTSEEWAERFELDAVKLEKDGPGPGTHPVLHRALIDASRSQAETLRHPFEEADINSDAL